MVRGRRRFQGRRAPRGRLDDEGVYGSSPDARLPGERIITQCQAASIADSPAPSAAADSSTQRLRIVMNGRPTLGGADQSPTTTDMYWINGNP
jgi:hypothetical protein